jgi:fumarate hydratase subunit beta
VTQPLRINTHEIKTRAGELRAGSRILLSGFVYTARDAAHKRIAQLMSAGSPLPFELDGAAVYYAGPTQAPENLCIGSCGPTTSSRMDIYSPAMLDAGLSAMIGKGERSPEVCKAIIRNGAVYLCALGGAGAIACRAITSCEVVAFEDLGCESVKRLNFKDFPLFVAIDSSGGNIFETGRAAYALQK